jgi:hypothetical protein
MKERNQDTTKIDVYIWSAVSGYLRKSNFCEISNFQKDIDYTPVSNRRITSLNHLYEYIYRMCGKNSEQCNAQPEVPAFPETTWWLLFHYGASAASTVLQQRYSNMHLIALPPLLFLDFKLHKYCKYCHLSISQFPLHDTFVKNVSFHLLFN